MDSLGVAEIIERQDGYLVLVHSDPSCDRQWGEPDEPGLIGVPCPYCGVHVTILWPDGLNYPSSGKEEARE